MSDARCHPVSPYAAMVENEFGIGRVLEPWPSYTEKCGSHRRSSKFPPGQLLTDNTKKTWCLGRTIGQGGFGLIYLASEDATATSDDKYAHVIKVEPPGNGPLFSEVYFYQRACRTDMVEEWKHRKKMKFLGIPQFYGTGQYEKSHRFLVIPRCGPDLQTLINRAGKVLPPNEVFSIGLRMMDCLEYIHNKEYVHADIKAANILTGWRNNKALYDEVYLMDYGLAYRFLVNGKHAEYKEEPKRCHDGTLEYCSRDAHKGVRPSRRGDLETLGFCMLQWLRGSLPWERDLSNKNNVSAEKHKCMSNLNLLKEPKSFSGQDTIIAFLQGVTKLCYTEEPDYQHFRDLLKKGLHREGITEASFSLASYGEMEPRRKASTDSKWKPKSDALSPQSLVRERDQKVTPIREVSIPKLGSPKTPAKQKTSRGKAAAAEDIIPGRPRESAPAKFVIKSVPCESGADIIPGCPRQISSANSRSKSDLKTPAAGNDIIPGHHRQISSANPRSRSDLKTRAAGNDIIPGHDRQISSVNQRSRSDLSTPATGNDIIPGHTRWISSANPRTRSDLKTCAAGSDIIPGHHRQISANPRTKSDLKTPAAGNDIIPGHHRQISCANPRARSDLCTPAAGSDIIPGYHRQISSANPRSRSDLKMHEAVSDIIPEYPRDTVTAKARSKSKTKASGADIIPGLAQKTGGPGGSKKVNPAEIIPGRPRTS